MSKGKGEMVDDEEGGESYGDFLRRDEIAKKFADDALSWCLEEEESVLEGLSFVKYLEKSHLKRVGRAIRLCDRLAKSDDANAECADTIRSVLVRFVVGRRKVRTLGVFDCRYRKDREKAEGLLASLGVEGERAGEVEIDNLGFVALCRSIYHVLLYVDFVKALADDGIVTHGLAGIYDENVRLLDVYKCKNKVGDGDTGLEDIRRKYRSIGVE